MRILHVIPSIAPSRGGPSYVVTQLALAQVRAGAEVRILATSSDLQPSDEAETLDLLDRGSVPLELVRIVGSARLELAPAWLPSLVRAARQVDLVHVHTVFTYPPAVTPLVCRLLRVPHVIRPAGTLDAACLVSRSTRSKHLAIAAYVRSNLLGADAVHVTSPLELEALRALAPAARLELIELGVPLAEPPAVEPNEFRIGYLGRLHPIKRLEVLLRAVARIPRAQLVLAGTGEPEYLESLRALAVSLGIRDRTSWLGHLGETAKREFLAGCALCAFPSSHESFGVAVAEAMAAGRAVVVAPEVGLAHEIEASRAGIVCAAEPAILARELERLLLVPRDLARMGAAGRLLAVARWSWPTIADRTLALYRELIARRS